MVEIALFERGWVTLSANFKEKGGLKIEFLRQRTRVAGLSRGVDCVILRLAILIQYRRVTHRQTHDDFYYSRIASAAWVVVKTFF